MGLSFVGFFWYNVLGIRGLTSRTGGLSMEQMYDLAVIGAGPGGYTAALTAAKLGMRVIVFEKRTLGGACLNIGCIPTKALACSASLYQTFQNCAWFGLSAPQTGFDYAKIHAYKELCVSQSRENIRAQFEAEGVVYIEGRAAVAGARSVRLTTADGVQRMYNARYILIASGARPNRPLFPGVLLPGVVTSTDVLTDSQWHYDRVAVIGGGVVGVELATILGALGAHVTIIEKKERLLAPMDGELSAALETLLRRRGIEVLPNATVERAAEGDGALTCTVRQGQELSARTVQRVLVAVGRKPCLEGLIDDKVPIRADDRGIIVDENFMTSVRGIYAVGDVLGGVQLAHLAAAQGMRVVEKLCGKTPSVMLSTVPSCAFVDLPIVPSCIYIDPEIASVGITETEARKNGIAVRCGKSEMRGNGRAIISHEESGFIKLVFEAHSHMLIGAQMMCPRATDMIGEMATAIANGLTARQLRYAMRAHPTFNEGVAKAILPI